MPVGPACSVRLYVGAGIPGKSGRYRKLPVAFDETTFRDAVESMVKSKFKSATFFKTRGAWQGGSEDGYMVEVVVSPYQGSCAEIVRRAEALAADLAFAFGQEAVMVVATDAAGNVQQGLVGAA